MLQAAVLLLEKLTAKKKKKKSKSLSRPLGTPLPPSKAPVARQYDSTRGGKGKGRRVWPHTISSLCLQERQCVNLNEGAGF